MSTISKLKKASLVFLALAFSMIAVLSLVLPNVAFAAGSSHRKADDERPDRTSPAQYAGQMGAVVAAANGATTPVTTTLSLDKDEPAGGDQDDPNNLAGESFDKGASSSSSLPRGIYSDNSGTPPSGWPGGKP
jgi:hypothetical protein